MTLHAPDVDRRSVLLVVEDLGGGVSGGSALCGEGGVAVKHVTEPEICNTGKAEYR